MRIQKVIVAVLRILEGVEMTVAKFFVRMTVGCMVLVRMMGVVSVMLNFPGKIVVFLNIH